MRNDSTWAQEVLVCLPCWKSFPGRGSDYVYENQPVELEVDEKICWVCDKTIGK
jgi:hypothetical protein